MRRFVSLISGFLVLVPENEDEHGLSFAYL